MIAITLADVDVVALRLAIPGTGAWIADVDLDVTPIPSGRVVLNVAGEMLVGTVDPRASGRMGVKAHVQVVAGAGGWDKLVPELDFHNDFGVLSTAVYSATAAAVGEVVVDPAPVMLGQRFARSAGPASRVLAGVAWHVDSAGVTRIGARADSAKAQDVDVLEWDPTTKRAVLASSVVVWPGTVLEDARFGTARVRDLEMTFGPSGARAIAWCETGATLLDVFAGGPLARGLAAIARESVGVTYLRSYRYRVATRGVDGRVTLQRLAEGPVPKVLKDVEVWTGVPGVAHEVKPGALVRVVFELGDPRFPLVVGFASDSKAAAVTIDADRVDVAGGGAPAAMATTGAKGLVTWISLVNDGLKGLGVTLPMPEFASSKLFTD